MPAINFVYVFVLASGLLVSGAVILSTLRRQGLPAIALNPIVLFSLYFSVIHFLTPLVKHLEGYYRYQASYSDLALISIAGITFLCYVGAVFLTRMLVSRRRHEEVKNGLRFISLGKVENVAILMFLVGGLAAWLDFRILDQIGMDAFLADRHLVSEERGSTRALANFMIVGFSLYVGAISVRHRIGKSRLFIMAMMLVLAFLYYSVISSRNSVLLMIIFGMAIFASNSPSRSNEKKGRTNEKKVAKKSFALIALTMALVIGAGYFLTIQRYGASNSEYAQSRLDRVELYMLDGAFGNDEAMLWMIDNRYEILGGKSYLAAVVNVVPRSVWSDKPLGGGPELINMIFPGSYVIGGERNNSLTTGLLTEAVMNFGILGAFLAIIAWALVTAFLLRAARKSKSVPLRTLYLMIIISLNTALLYSEFLGFLVRLGMFIFPLLMLQIFRPKWGRRQIYV